MLPKKQRKETIAKNKRTEMLLKNLPYKSYAKNIRSKMLPKKLQRKTIAKNERFEMLLKVHLNSRSSKKSVFKKLSALALQLSTIAGIRAPGFEYSKLCGTDYTTRVTFVASSQAK